MKRLRLLIFIAVLQCSAGLESPVLCPLDQDVVLDTSAQMIHLVQSKSKKIPAIRTKDAQATPITEATGSDTLEAKSDSLFPTSSELFQKSAALLQVWHSARERVASKAGPVPEYIFILAALGIMISIIAIFATALAECGRNVSAQAQQLVHNPRAALLARSRPRQAFGNQALLQSPSGWHSGAGITAAPAQVPQFMSLPVHPAAGQAFYPAGATSTLPLGRSSPLPVPGATAVTEDGSYHQQIVVARALEGGRLGLNMSDEGLRVSSYSDTRAEILGFRIGDQIVQVNGRPVQRQADFVPALQEAVQLNAMTNQPLIFDVLRRDNGMPLEVRPLAQPDAGTLSQPLPPAPPPASMPPAQTSAPASAPPAPASPSASVVDVCGSWRYGDSQGLGSQFVYTISRVDGQLRFDQQLPPDGRRISGLLYPDKQWLRSKLFEANGQPFADIQIEYESSEDALVFLMKKEGEKDWGEEVVAQRV